MIGRGQALVGDHAVLDGVADVDQAAHGGAVGCSRRRGGTLVLFGEDAFVADGDVADHQEVEVAHGGVGEGGIIDGVAGDVEAEALAMEVAAVAEVDVEVELDTVLGMVVASHGGPSFG